MLQPWSTAAVKQRTGQWPGASEHLNQGEFLCEIELGTVPPT